jgi:hypothetical protein
VAREIKGLEIKYMPTDAFPDLAIYGSSLPLQQDLAIFLDRKVLCNGEEGHPIELARLHSYSSAQVMIADITNTPSNRFHYKV